MSSFMPRLKDASLLKDKSFINGAWVSARSDKSFEVHDPATGELIGTMPEMNKDDTADAIRAAEVAFQSFRKTLPRERAEILRRWHEQILQHVDDLATLITWENGKPLHEAKGEAIYTANFFEWYSEEAPRIYGETIPATVPGNRVYTTKEPVGVCGLLTPWNFPAAMIARKIGPALAAGCTVVAKTPGEAPFTAAALMELGHRAGVPPGVVNTVTALENTAEVGEAITSSHVVKKISFTGSTRVGKLLMQQSSSSLKKMSLELGGNAPFIVFDDADLDAAVTGAIGSKYRSSGQTCICANRIFVHEDIMDEFARRFTREVEGFKVGHGFEAGITHGPLIHQQAVDKVKAHISDAVDRGAEILTGGQPFSKLGPNFFQPTVLRNVTTDMLIAKEETFGPIAGLFRFQTETEVVKMANECDVGLAAYMFSRDVARCYRISEALNFGMVGINTGMISDTVSPFGGVKHSGFGREGSKYGIEEFLFVKTMTVGGNGKDLGDVRKDHRNGVM